MHVRWRANAENVGELSSDEAVANLAKNVFDDFADQVLILLHVQASFWVGMLVPSGRIEFLLLCFDGINCSFDVFSVSVLCSLLSLHR
jgi:hypothetical protein